MSRSLLYPVKLYTQHIYPRIASRALQRTRFVYSSLDTSSGRFLSTTVPLRDRTSSASKPPNLHTNFYRAFSRPLFKALTLAFLSYQFFYWFWLTIEHEAYKDGKDGEIRGLKEEVRMLSEGRGSHTLGNGTGRNLLEEGSEIGRKS